MPPPKEVPENLKNADEYFKLSIQYLLMNWKRQAVTAFKKSVELHKSFFGTPLMWMNDEHYRNLGMALGLVETSMNISEAANEAAKNVFLTVSQAADGIEPIKQFRQDFQTTLKNVTNTALDAISDAASDVYVSVMKLPSNADIPDGLSAERYYRMGVQYKLMGWTEHAREAFTKAAEKEHIGYYGKKARQHLNTKLPRFSIHYKAVRKNRFGLQQLLREDLDGAKATFEEIIDEYPNFEWPYANLGKVYFCQGDTANARRVIQKALQINPSYVTAWTYLSTVDAIDSNFRAAHEALNRATQLDSEDPNASALAKILSTLSSLK